MKWRLNSGGLQLSFVGVIINAIKFFSGLWHVLSDQSFVLSLQYVFVHLTWGKYRYTGTYWCYYDCNLYCTADFSLLQSNISVSNNDKLISEVQSLQVKQKLKGKSLELFNGAFCDVCYNLIRQLFSYERWA